MTLAVRANASAWSEPAAERFGSQLRDKDELIGMYRAYAEVRRRIKAECNRIADGLQRAQRGMSRAELEEAFTRAILIRNLPK